MIERTRDDGDDKSDEERLEALVLAARQAMQAAALEPKPEEHLPINSEDDPLVIPYTDHSFAVGCEYDWIGANYGYGSSVSFQAVMTVGDRKLDFIEFKTATGERWSVYFDITRAWNAMVEEIERITGEGETESVPSAPMASDP